MRWPVAITDRLARIVDPSSGGYDGATRMTDDSTLASQSDLSALIQGAVRAEFDPIVGHLVSALKRNEGVAALVDRLDAAERRLAERQQRPMVVGLYMVLSLVRRLDFEPAAKAALELELTNVLSWSGYREFGEIGENFEPARHEPIDGFAGAGSPVVARVLEPGLETLGEVLVRAKVTIESAGEWTVAG
jgi:hypothetical protein